MTSITTDRIAGLGGDVAAKAPCRVATSSNITLSGLQTIDGEVLVENDRVLVKSQTTTSENGIWVASSTSWARALDFDGARDVVNGSLVLVAEGSDPGRVYKTDVTDPVVIGTDAIAFSYVSVNAAAAPGSIDTTELADQAVSTAKLEDGSVTSVKLNDAVFSGLTDVTPTTSDKVVISDASDSNKPKEAGVDALLKLDTVVIAVPVTTNSGAVASGTSKFVFRMPFAMTVTAVRGSLRTAQSSGSILTVDVNDGGTTILSTKLTIDNSEKTSTTAATAAVISDSALADDAEISIDVDQIGDGTAAGLIVYLIGNRA